MFFDDEDEFKLPNKEMHDRIVVERARRNGFAEYLDDNVRKIIRAYNAGSCNDLGVNVTQDQLASFEGEDTRSEYDVSTLVNNMTDYAEIYTREHPFMQSITVSVTRVDITLNVDAVSYKPLRLS